MCIENIGLVGVITIHRSSRPATFGPVTMFSSSFFFLRIIIIKEFASLFGLLTGMNSALPIRLRKVTNGHNSNLVMQLHFVRFFIIISGHIVCLHRAIVGGIHLSNLNVSEAFLLLIFEKKILSSYFCCLGRVYNLQTSSRQHRSKIKKQFYI